MRYGFRFGLGAALTLMVAFACSDILGPNRGAIYEWRLFVPFDSTGPRIDSLTFHWPRTSLPVTYWVEDSLQVPAHVRAALDRWAAAFLYGEFKGQVVGDSNTADVIVRVMTPPAKPVPSIRFNAMLPECEGATDIDTVATRNQLRLPVRIYLNPRIAGTGLDACLQVTALHEVGHSLGLFVHSADPMDIMYSDPQVTQLSAKDISTVEVIYHLVNEMVPTRP